MVNSHTWLLERAHVSRRGKASGMMASAIFLGQFASPIVIQPAVAVLGLQPTFGAVGGIMLLLCMVLLKKRN
jgi:MFS family permease